MATDRSEPAPARHHPFPVAREQRQGDSASYVVGVMLCVLGICYFVGKLRDLVDQADADAIRAGLGCHLEAHRRRGGKHGRP